MEEKLYRQTIDAAEHITNKYFPVSWRTLHKIRCTGGGPSFRKVGRQVIYDVAALDQWALSKISKPIRSTSEMEAA